MQRKIQIYDTIFQVLFFALCVFYILFYGPYGFEGTDTGYIFGTSWNIYNGELPHRDFIYTRPTVPAYFHTIFLFVSETYGYLLDRAFFYVQVFTYSLLGTKILFKHFSIVSKSALYTIAILAALISIHNYPPMGWNTIDGVFFCILGLYFLLKLDATKWRIFLGVLFLVMGVFSKQSFYFFPVFLFVYLAITKQFRILKFYSLFGIFWVLVYLGIKYFTGTFYPFFEQTFARTGSGDLIQVGIKTYYLAVKFNILYALVGALLIFLLKKFAKPNIAYFGINVLIAAIFIFFFYKFKSTWHVIPFLMQLLFIGSSIFCFIKLIGDKRYLLPILLLCLSWSASISNGYQTPIHFSLPIVFCLFLFVFSLEIEITRLRALTFVATISIFLVTFFYGYQTLYRDADRSSLVYNMGDIYKELSFIKSDKDTYLKYKEFKNLSGKYSNFTVIPSITLAHYLGKTVNPIGTDWPLDVEINDKGKLLLAQLVQKNVTVFLENSEFTETELEGYIMEDEIIENWQLIEKTDYFDVYQPFK